MFNKAKSLNGEEMQEYLAARNAALEERSALYVAQHPTTKLYLIGVKRFLDGQVDWIASAKATPAMVKEQLDYVETRRSIWTNDLNEADIWSDIHTKYFAERYGNYLPPVEFVKVDLTTTDPSSNN